MNFLKKITRKLNISNIWYIASICFLTSFILCEFHSLGESTREVIAHSTGILAASSSIFCFCIALKLFIKDGAHKIGVDKKIWNSYIYSGLIGFPLMIIGYMAYLILHISPSNYTLFSSVLVSETFDAATFSTHYSWMVGALIIFRLLNRAK